MKKTIKLSRSTVLVCIFIIFAIIFGLVSLVNHYQFRTAAQDLGMISHAVYSFAHFSQNYYTLSVGGSEMNYFADHFSPITILYAPFYYLFGSYTLLIIQIASILFGGWGLYKYSLLYFKDSYIPIIIVLHFFGIWAIYSALSFDFHNNVVAAMLVPWIFYFYEKKQVKFFLLFFLLVLITKENMALWLVFILLGLIIKQGDFNFKRLMKLEIPVLFFTIIYFFMVIGFITPYLRDGAGFSQLARYGHLGDSIPQVLNTLIHKPLYVFSLFFENTLNKPILDGIKMELHFMVLISGGFALFFRPYYLIMLLPIYAQKMLTNDHIFWGINLQYSIEFAPILSICLIDLLTKINSLRIVYLIAIATTISTYFFTYKKMEHRKALWYDRRNTVFYKSNHYDSQLNLKEIYKQLEKIPVDSIISASTNLTPHLTNRKKIYTFPNVKDASYLVLFTSGRSTYPLNKEKFDAKIDEYMKSNKFDVVYNENALLILKRNYYH